MEMGGKVFKKTKQLYYEGKKIPQKKNIIKIRLPPEKKRNKEEAEEYKRRKKEK